MTDRPYSQGTGTITPEELDAFLARERICRVGTVSTDGAPHVSPLWFAWDGKSIWIYSLLKSQRWKDLERDPRVSIVIDTGHDISELRGVEFRGKVERVGELPRVGEPNAELEEPERLFGEKYMGRSQLQYDGHHGWLRLLPERIVTWDLGKLRAEDRAQV